MMEMDSPHQDLQHNKKFENSTVLVERNSKATLEVIVSTSPKLRTQNRSSSRNAHNDLITGVCSLSEDSHLTRISGGMDGEVTSEENSGKNRVPNVGVHGSVSKNTDSQTKGTRRVGLFDHLKGEISVDNNSTTSIDSTTEIP